MIKFRAWDNECKVIREYDELKGLTLDALDASDFKLEQFTGLKDVNGKEIYIGDIIQYSDHFYGYSMGGVTDLETEYIGIVVKNNWNLGILINRISHTDAHINHYNAKEFVPFCEFDDPEADVLLKGNVHANPELLEEEK
ncbi:YopX family protein [Lactiplantibacillus plantarum]|uniref:YopX family protein n=1 Tax=Lactiplantibacillus plantarum TaxID=1590 RepID=UPI003D68CA4F